MSSTYSVSHYNEYQQTKNKNLFEEIVDQIMLDGINPILQEKIKNLPLEDKRMAILAFLDKDRNLFMKIKSLISRENLSKMDYVKDVVRMLREYVKVGEVEKKKFGEVMTSLDLVKEMISTLPEEVWSNPNLKWLDPANGTGPFPIMVIYKLMNGLEKEFPDPNIRYKHIVENMIYTCELQAKNVFLWLCAVDPHDEYETNTYWGSFLDETFDNHMRDVWRIEKFDVVLGNPPYQDNTGKVGKTAATLWPRFVQKSIESIIKFNGYLLFITPISWMSPGRQLIRNRKMPLYFTCNNFMHLNINCSRYFNSVGSYFSYYLLQIKNRYSESRFDCITKVISEESEFEFNFSRLNFIPIPKSLNLLSVISKISNKGPKFNLESSSTTRSDKIWVKKTKTDEFKYPIKHTNKEILWSSRPPESIDIKKIIINSTGNFNPIYDDGNLGTSQITRWIKVDSEHDGKEILKYLRSNTIRYFLGNCRWSGAAAKEVFENIPKIDFKKSWTDKQLYEYFNLTEQEINLIENSK